MSDEFLAFNDALHIFRSEKFQSVVNEAVSFFASTPLHPLPPTNRFIGPGVYGLFYSGDFAPYEKMAALNRPEAVLPIYIGKAVPPGWRTGRANLSETADLLQRLQQHSNTIRATSNLNLEHFSCRFMILKDRESDLIVPVEAELIRRYQPLWNQVIDGFGNHDPGSGRYNQAKSAWDVLHPGRGWATRLTGVAPSIDDVMVRIRKYSDSLTAQIKGID